ncbi:DUF4249 domain-containing protein [Pedobacter gandavensis]|uniref:DUF4249 family protein n=1 Tax=Pedobacter gandavensis TaxID=2679963 RepID=A0ABR6F1C9_9SPHI|nr:DUF4249 domain-containing protein [Pedobacter gandavensis]MBB2151329.1 DUF4249 family protein [Pedobacter gandavensis]
MMSFRNTLLWIGLISLFYACKKEVNPGLYKPKFVVEGWIEEGDFPYVILTHNLPFFTAVDSAQLAEVIIRYAKVTVSNGTETEVLTATTDKRYFPYFLYRGTSLRGKVGGKYSLKVEYAGNTLTAETEIPNPVSIDSLWFVEKPKNKRQLNVQIMDAPNEVNYYRLYSKLEKETVFTPTLMANHDDLFFNGKMLEMQVNRGAANNLTSKHDPYYEAGDTVLVKLSAVPASGYVFWKSLQDELMNGSNPLAGSAKALATNINGPGVGVWCGYSSKIYRMIAR